jgi:hypothetical protein
VVALARKAVACGNEIVAIEREIDGLPTSG